MRRPSAARLELERRLEAIPRDPVHGHRLPNRIGTFLKWLDKGAAADYTRFALVASLNQARRGQFAPGGAETFGLMLDALVDEHQIDSDALRTEQTRLRQLEMLERTQKPRVPQPSLPRRRLTASLGTVHDPPPSPMDDRVRRWILSFLASFNKRRGPAHFARRLFRSELPALLEELGDSQQLQGALPCLHLIVDTLETEKREALRHIEGFRRTLDSLTSDRRLI